MGEDISTKDTPNTSEYLRQCLRPNLSALWPRPYLYSFYFRYITHDNETSLSIRLEGSRTSPKITKNHDDNNTGVYAAVEAPTTSLYSRHLFFFGAQNTKDTTVM